MVSKKFLNERVEVKTGDITRETVDAIVNAANSSLLGGGGVDGAIHDAGGAWILEECREIRREQFPDGLPTGEAVITSGGNLPAKFVIHTVGPIYGRNKNKDTELLLKNCYGNSLSLAFESKLKTIAFPSISTGAYGYPKREAAKVASLAIKEFLDKNQTLEKVLLVFFSEADTQIFLANQLFQLSETIK